MSKTTGDGSLSKMYELGIKVTGTIMIDPDKKLEELRFEASKRKKISRLEALENLEEFLQDMPDFELVDEV